MVSCERHTTVSELILRRSTGKPIGKQRECQGVRSPEGEGVTQGLTITHKLEQGQVNLPLPRGALLESNSIASGGKDVPTPDGHQLAAFIPPGLVVQDRCIIDESVQFPAMIKHQRVMGTAGYPFGAQLPGPNAAPCTFFHTTWRDSWPLHPLVIKGSIFNEEVKARTFSLQVTRGS